MFFLEGLYGKENIDSETRRNNLIKITYLWNIHVINLIGAEYNNTSRRHNKIILLLSERCRNINVTYIISIQRFFGKKFTIR